MLDVFAPAQVEEGFRDVRYSVRFREYLFSNFNDSREVEVIPVYGSVIDAANVVSSPAPIFTTDARGVL